MRRKKLPSTRGGCLKRQRWTRRVFVRVVDPGIRAWFGHKLHFKAGLCFNKFGALLQVQSSNFSQMAIKQVCRDLARTLCENSLCCHNFAFVCLRDQGDCTSKKVPLLPRDRFEVRVSAPIQELPSTRLQFTLKTIQKRHVKLYVMKIVTSMQAHEKEFLQNGPGQSTGTKFRENFLASGDIIVEKG